MSKSRLRIILFVLLFVNPLLLPAQIIESGSWTDWLKYVCTNGAGAPTPNRIAKLSGAPSRCVTAGTSDTTGLVGITVAWAGTSGSAEVQRLGLASCDFDGSTTAGDSTETFTPIIFTGELIQ